MKSQQEKVVQYARTVKEIGVEVQELLRQESDDKDARERTLKMLNLALTDESTMEKVTSRVDETKASLARFTKQSKTDIARENKLIAAVEKKKNDVERNYKLLASLKISGAEPTHNAEHDRLQNELEVEYERYVVKIRNIDYLESELRSHHSLLLQQRERSERKIRRMRDAYYNEEELPVVEGEGGEAESAKRDNDSAANTSLSEDDTDHSGSDGDESISAPSCGDMSSSVSVEAEEYDSDGSDF